MRLTTERIALFQGEGYLLAGAASPNRLQMLRAETAALHEIVAKDTPKGNALVVSASLEPSGR
jgi:hypothetical protein